MAVEGLTSSNLDAMSIGDRIATIRQSLPPSVRLIAVSKQVPVEAMRLAYAAGIRDFGENRVQEAIAKQAELSDLPDLTWHFIGHLQSNKARKALEHFQWIHSVDQLKLAQRLHQLAMELNLTPMVLLQIKLLPDPNKSGWAIPDLLRDLPELDQCTALRIQGLMTIPPINLASSQILDLFQKTADLAATIRSQGWQHLPMTELSMGMSEDYALAVRANTTMIRLGQILFGKRTK